MMDAEKIIFVVENPDCKSFGIPLKMLKLQFSGDFLGVSLVKLSHLWGGEVLLLFEVECFMEDQL